MEMYAFVSICFEHSINYPTASAVKEAQYITLNREVDFR